jgi:hypothetical protein
MTKKINSILLIAVAFLIGFVGCGGSDDDEVANVRVVHASPDAPGVDVFIDGGSVLSNLTTGNASEYLEVSAGSRRVQVNATGTDTSAIDETLTLDDGKSYTVLAVNRLANIKPLVVEDTRTASASGKANIRAIHAVPGVPVDVYITAPGAALDTVQPAVSNFQFEANTGYVELDAGSYQVRITAAGSKTVVIDSGAVTLESGSRTTAVAVQPFKLVVMNDRE